jgi:hypothetical protein
MAEFRRDVPEALEVLAQQALAWKPMERPTAEEYALALTRFALDLDDALAPPVLATEANHSLCT